MSFVKAFDESMKDKYELVLVSVSWDDGSCSMAALWQACTLACSSASKRTS